MKSPHSGPPRAHRDRDGDPGSRPRHHGDDHGGHGRHGGRRDASFVYGLQACLALVRRRPDAIQRVFFSGERAAAAEPILQAAAARGRFMQRVSREVLDGIADSVHHEGIVVFADPPAFVPLPALLGKLPRDAFLLAIDGVGNPHNLGAILRTAAWFGASGVIFSTNDARQAHLGAAAQRVAQGAAEVVPCVAVPHLARALQSVADAGVTVVVAEAGSGVSPFGEALPRPLCVVLGNESEGVTPAVRGVARRTVSIPGTGAVDSLNVSVAAGILLAAVARTGLGTPPELTAPPSPNPGRRPPRRLDRERRGSRRGDAAPDRG